MLAWMSLVLFERKYSKCFFCVIRSGELVLKEHEAAKWMTVETLDSVDWLPADKGLVEGIREYLDNCR